MPNIFDQFDDRRPNPFDRFDPPSSKPRGRKTVPEGGARLDARQEAALERARNRKEGSEPRALPEGHRDFDGSNVPGYNPETGRVEKSGAIDKVGAFANAAVEGVPVAGPVLRKATQAAAAGIVAPFSDEDFGTVYDQMDRANSRVMEDNPRTATAGAITGAVAGTLPLIAAAPAAFGAGGGGLLLRSGASALSGAALGGTDAAVRSGGDLGDTARGAVVGGLTGAAGPAAGEVIGAGARRIADAFRGAPERVAVPLTRGAERQLTKAMRADDLTPAQLQQRLAELGDNAMILDAGPNLAGKAAGMVAKPGPARSIVQNAIRDRDAGANQRILSTLDETLGPAPVPSRIDAGIRDQQRALSPLYEDALRDARAVDTTPIANELDSAIVNLRGPAQGVLRDVRRMLNIHGADDVLDPHPRALLATRQSIDGMLDGMQDGNVRRVLGNARTMIDDELTRAVPGIKEVDSRFQELARQRGALEQGQTALRGGNDALRPIELADAFTDAVQPRGAMVGPSGAALRMRQGTRAELDRIVGTNANDRAALQRLVAGDGDWNPQKLATIFGPERARRVLDVLEAERVFAGSSDFVTRNSATAARTEAVKELDGIGRDFGIRDAWTAGGTPGAVRGTIRRGVDGVIDAIMRTRRDALKSSLAQGMTKGSREVVEALLRRQEQVLRQQLAATRGTRVAVPLLLGTTLSAQNGSRSGAR